LPICHNSAYNYLDYVCSIVSLSVDDNLFLQKKGTGNS
jgi:hypothetical protein